MTKLRDFIPYGIDELTDLAAAIGCYLCVLVLAGFAFFPHLVTELARWMP